MAFLKGIQEEEQREGKVAEEKKTGIGKDKAFWKEDTMQSRERAGGKAAEAPSLVVGATRGTAHKP
jgi:hypothetical protein